MPPMRLGLFPAPQKRTLPTMPANYGAADNANLEIERTIAMANERYTEALKVNPVPIMLWRRTLQGRVCTCKTQSTTAFDEADNGTRHDNDGSYRPLSDTIRIQSSRDLEDKVVSQKSRILGIDFGHDEEDIQNPQIIKRDDSLFLDNDSVMQHFLQSGTQTTTCGICFGTGYTNGYSLYGGQRIVFDSQNIDKNEGFEPQNKYNEPTMLVGVEGAKLEWSWNVPAFFMDGTIVARANTKPSDVQILINNTPLTYQGLKAFKGQTVTVTALALNDDAEITHIESVLQFNPWQLTQLDNIQNDTNYTSIEPTTTFDFPLSPAIDKVDRGDVFTDLKYNRVWRINSVTDYKLSSGTLISWTVNATSRTRFDLLSLLKTNVQPQYSLSFDSIQAI